MTGLLDYAIVGSGFGGSVAAYRLSQRGYRVAVFEMGKRFGAAEFPETNWDVRRYFWAPRLGCRGILKVDPLRHLTVLSGTGVGGGSLVYGNTLFTPRDEVFAHPRLAPLGGKAGLSPFFDQAKQMLGVVENPRMFEPDHLLRATADEYGRGHTFHRSPVGIYFGEPDVTVPDPYFDGRGPARTGCNFCGGCFVGCRYGAKNTLDLNYLYLAESLGAEIHAEHEVVDVRPLSPDGSSGYEIESAASGAGSRRARKVHRARGVIFSAGVLGTVGLLFRLKTTGRLPRLSDRLGCEVRSNGESIIGVKARDPDVDYSRGIAASSSVFPDEHTHIQADRYPAGSDALGLASTLLTDGGGRVPRPLRLLANVLTHPRDFLVTQNPFGFARRSIILVVMQDVQSSLRLVVRRSRIPPFRHTLTSDLAEGESIPTYLPIANDFARRLAARMNGVAGSGTVEVLLDSPMTAHILGGCTIGRDPSQGVVDANQRVFGYDNMLVCDGSVIPVNLGVNPALSITAFCEHAMSAIDAPA